MSLRTRLTISVGLLVACAIALSGWLVVRAASDELHGEIDEFLETRVEGLASGGLLGQRPGFDFNEVRSQGRGRPPRPGIDSLTGEDSVIQLVTGKGDVLVLGEVVFPVTHVDLEIASGGHGQALRTVEVDGTSYRVITARLRDTDAALMVGRDLTEVDAALSGLTGRTLVLGAVGAALAALVAWALASRLARPIDRLTSAAEQVAATQDLSASIEVRDSGEVGRLADSFNTMLVALDTSRRQQHRLVMDASHELRTPLTALRTNVDVLRRVEDLDAAVRDDVLADVSGELVELTALVTELVELATSSRRPSDAPEPVLLSAVVTAVAERATRRSGPRVGVEVVEDASVSGQRTALERAVSNLVDNALKFSEGNVEVTVDGTSVLVRDHGPGVSAQDRPRIFDRFYRSDTTRSAPGSGLGLSIVKEIVDSHGGEVLVDQPSDGVGVIIGFRLPATP